MITRPSTSRVLEDVVVELTRDILPMITDPAQQIRLHMLMVVLNDCVNASEREISVMRTEIPEYLAFAGDVAGDCQGRYAEGVSISHTSNKEASNLSRLCILCSCS